MEVNRNDQREKGQQAVTPPNATTENAVKPKLAELLRQAATQPGVRALSFNELLGDPEAGDPEKEDVDNFIATAARE
ncbi:MAG: hypothetical protein WKF84_11725 [Pyrinomonadaceae bacterium]